MEDAAVVLLSGVLGVLLGAVGAGAAVLTAIRALRREERATRAAVDQLARVVASPQGWFWTPQWQAGEREADEDLAEGRTVRFDSIKKMDTYLDALPAPYAGSR